MKTKCLLVFTLITFYSARGFSQPFIMNQAAAGGSLSDLSSCMALTTDGGFITGGYSNSNSSGNKTENTRGANGRSDYWIIKYNKAGKIEWDKTIGGDEDDKLVAIQQTTDGGYILGGNSNSNIFAEKTQNNRGNYTDDYWILKLDASGKIEWDKTIGGNNGDELSTVKQTADGGYILGGYSYSDKSGEKTQNAKGDGDYWIVKLDALGNVQWDKTVGGSGIDFLGYTQQTTDGGYIVAGSSESGISGNKTGANKGETDFWVVKLNAAGNIQWDKTYGGSREDNISAIRQTTDGSYVIGGFSESGISGDKTEKPRGLVDYWVVKTDAGGNVQWDKTVGGDQIDYLTDIEQTSNGGYILCGSSWSNISGEKTENSKDGNSAYTDYWIVLLNKDGKVKADKTIGSVLDDHCFSIKQTSGQHFIVGGYTSAGISGDKISPSKGNTDYWTVKLGFNENIAAGATQNDIVQTKNNHPVLSIYPNPAKDVINIAGLSANTTIEITDMRGRAVLKQTISSNTPVNISTLIPGVYFLKYANAANYKTIKFVKE